MMVCWWLHTACSWSVVYVGQRRASTESIGFTSTLIGTDMTPHLLCGLNQLPLNGIGLMQIQGGTGSLPKPKFQNWFSRLRHLNLYCFIYSPPPKYSFQGLFCTNPLMGAVSANSDPNTSAHRPHWTFSRLFRRGN